MSTLRDKLPPATCPAWINADSVDYRASARVALSLAKLWKMPPAVEKWLETLSPIDYDAARLAWIESRKSMTPYKVNRQRHMVESYAMEACALWDWLRREPGMAWRSTVEAAKQAVGLNAAYGADMWSVDKRAAAQKVAELECGKIIDEVEKEVIAGG
jgi:hypothetical protein